jgi:hypothetical protein
MFLLLARFSAYLVLLGRTGIPGQVRLSLKATQAKSQSDSPADGPAFGSC